MKKFAVFSGFLGSGKTSAMMALSRRNNVAMITNDLGSDGLADHRLARFKGCNASEITGDCICYKNEELTRHLDGLYARGFELVISDIPGFGVGALEHVYHAEGFAGSFELSPFTVLAEPETIRALRADGERALDYILRSQLAEADLIALNKCDTLSLDDRRDMENWLRQEFPMAKVLCISAGTGENMDGLYRALMEGRASMRRPDIGYGGEAFTRIMEQVTEYNMQYYAQVCCDSFDGNEYLMALAEQIQANAAALPGAELPHLKLLAWEAEGDYGKLDILGIRRPIEQSRRFARRCTELAAVINSRAICPSAGMDEAISRGVEEVSEKFDLELMIFRKEKI